jgi:hypothetical protein
VIVGLECGLWAGWELDVGELGVVRRFRERVRFKGHLQE